MDPYTNAFLNGWSAFKQGANGLNYWLTISAGCNDMNEYFVTTKDWGSIVTPFYFDDGTSDPLQRVHTGKHWEAIFEGREDYEYLYILSIFIDYLKEKDPANPTITESETLRQGVIDAVIRGEWGTNYVNYSYETSADWSISRDRSVSDTQRNLIWNKINELSAALNISSVHKIKVMQSAGGTIDPPGTDGGEPNHYYAPDKFFIVADGESQEFTFAPEPGYVITDVMVNCQSQGVISSYTFTNITEDSTLQVTFSLN